MTFLPLCFPPSLQDAEYVDEDEFEIEQSLIGRLIHLLYVPGEPDVTFEILGIIRKNLELGGAKKMVMTLPPLVFTVLKLVRELHAGGGGGGEVTKEKVRRRRRRRGVSCCWTFYCCCW